MKLRSAKCAIAAFAILLGMVLATPTAMAAVDGIGCAYLTTDGGDDLVGTDWKFYVETPAAVGLDADYWNFTIYAYPLNASATNATFYVHYHINDGATNITGNSTVAAKNDVTVYANQSFEKTANYSTMVENKSGAIIYLELLDADGVLLDEIQLPVLIYAQSYIATLVAMLYALIPIVVVMAVLNYIKGAGKGPNGK